MGEYLSPAAVSEFNPDALIEIESDEKLELQERCGIVGIFSRSPKDQLGVTLLAAGGVQHRGQNGVGLASWSPTDSRYMTGNGLIREVFTPDVVHANGMQSMWTLFHCRYGTDGGYGLNNLQPIQISNPDGSSVSVVHNGQFAAIDSMRGMLHEQLPGEASDTVLFAHLLVQEQGNTWDDKICTTLSKVNGAYSLLIGVENALYVARDEFGIRPLVLGHVQGYGYMAASETLAIDKAGGKVIRQLNPGEVLRIDVNGLTVIRPGDTSHMDDHGCDLEGAYFSHPNSLRPISDDESATDVANWESFQAFRQSCGIVAAKEHPIMHADFVVGVPDSGVAFAQGYANTLHIPYQQLILRDHFDPNGHTRLFLGDAAKEKIAQKVLGKLLVIPDRIMWKDKIVVVADDSMIRGNVSSEVTWVLKSLGAREVHWMLGFPRVIDRCHLGVSIRTGEELIAARHNGDDRLVAQAIGATSVNYISPQGFLAARRHTSELVQPKDPRHIFLDNGACGGCVTGVYPVSSGGEIYKRSAV